MSNNRRHYDSQFLLDCVAESLAIDPKISYKSLARSIGYSLESVRKVAIFLGYPRRRGIKGVCQGPLCTRAGVSRAKHLKYWAKASARDRTHRKIISLGDNEEL